MATYSLAITGVGAGNPFQPVALTIDDAYARPGSQALASSQGAPFLCKRPDGSSAWFVYDAERSIPGQTRILRRV